MPCHTHLVLCTAVLIAHLDSDVQDHTAIKEGSLEEKKKFLICCKKKTPTPQKNPPKKPNNKNPNQNKTTKNSGNFAGLSSRPPHQLPLLTFSLAMILSHKLGEKNS